MLDGARIGVFEIRTGYRIYFFFSLALELDGIALGSAKWFCF